MESCNFGTVSVFETTSYVTGLTGRYFFHKYIFHRFGVTKGNGCLQNLASEKNGRKHLICSCILHFALGVGDMAQLVDPCTCNWVAVIMLGCIIFQGFGPEDSC